MTKVLFLASLLTLAACGEKRPPAPTAEQNDQLNEGRDLAVTTDFRNVFAEIANKHLSVRDLKTLFPKYSVSTSNFRGFVS